MFSSTDVSAAFVDEGPLVTFETDAVAGVVTLQLGDTELGEGVADVGFGLGERRPGRMASKPACCSCIIRSKYFRTRGRLVRRSSIVRSSSER